MRDTKITADRLADCQRVADELASGEVLTSTTARTLLSWHTGPTTPQMNRAAAGDWFDRAELSREVCAHVHRTHVRRALVEWVWTLDTLAADR